MSIHYSRFNTHRKKKYQLMTLIGEEEGGRYVEKQAVYEEGKNHCRASMAHYARLTTVHPKVHAVPVVERDECTIRFPYVTGKTGFPTHVTEAYKAGKEQFLRTIEEYKVFLGYFHKSEEKEKEAFLKLFGKRYKEHVYFCSPGVLDVNFDNLFYEENSKEWTIIDYEWVFPCAFPKEFLLVRALYYWYGSLTAVKKDQDFFTLLKWVGIKAEAFEEFLHVEYVVQKEVNQECPTEEAYIDNAYVSLKRKKEQLLVYPKLNEEQFKVERDREREVRRNLTEQLGKTLWEVDTFPTYDIIIPVYNGYTFVKECVESVLAHTYYPNYRILIIDDCSPDEQTQDYLTSIADREKILLIRKEVNGGFVQSVNTGMAASENDVVLLNSDTVVTENWLLKMHRCRMQNVRTGSVTPLTNNGTICSIPDWLQDNALPKGHTAETMNQVVEHATMRQYPTLPTAVGFCMLIPREAIKAVGLFDAETFGKGYGEENDWCVRALNLGFQHYLDDATFIQHKGSMTFGNDAKKQALLEENLSLLTKKHPQYIPSVQQFIQNDPLRMIRDNIRLALEFSNGKKNILMILHADIRGAIGGTELHVDHLARHFCTNYNVFILFPEPTHYRLTLLLRTEEAKEMRVFHFPFTQEKSDTLLVQKEIAEALKTILEEANIALVHMHHLKGWPLAVHSILCAHQVPYFYTVHDYFFHCEIPQLLEGGKKFCAFSRAQHTCTQCIGDTKELTEKAYTYARLEERRQVFAEVLREAHTVIAPSQYVSTMTTTHTGRKEVVVIPHAIDYCQNKRGKSTNMNTLRVAFLGAFTEIKGSRVFEELVLKNKERNIEFFLLGKIGDHGVQDKLWKKVKHLGAYTKEEVSRILHENDIDLVVLPSIWPETFAYTMSEALESGIKVVTTALGAQKERIEEDPERGWCFPLESFVIDTHILFAELLKKKERGEQVHYAGKAGITTEEMLHGYSVLYHDVSHSIFPTHVGKKGTGGQLLLATQRAQGAQGNPRGHLQWKDYVYLFLVKVKLIAIARPIYYTYIKYTKKP